jgi:hypothetical protein
MLRRPVPNIASEISGGRVSRRVLLRRGGLLAIGGVIAGHALGVSRAIAAAKVPKTQAGYKEPARGGMRCDRCMQFQPPAGCAIVDGAISPGGSCNFFAPKPG